MTGTRPYIRVKGVIDYANVDINGKALTIFGDTSSVLRGAGGLGPGADDSLLDLSNGAKVSIYDLTLRDARREGIRVDDAASTLLLQRSKVIDMGEHGIVISNGGQASIIQSEISECQGAGRYGVNVTAGQVEISRSKIFDNSGGVFVADGQQFQITNSFIVENISLGGLRIQSLRLQVNCSSTLLRTIVILEVEFWMLRGLFVMTPLTRSVTILFLEIWAGIQDSCRHSEHVCTKILF